ncbi:MAG: biosynthetic-type acetolactate synthase large subunit [Oscillospiraceae bacterium]|jgi:acetolactate synthase-1/2/3 large subunit|nr:biosynthetic-type acetolactate synthase large subunit [Oscillospiraceae bacterium]
MRMTGADILLECLLEQGADTVFGYPGGAVLNIYDSLYKYKDKIRHIITSHEQHAGHAADGYARATGKTGVVLATSGPGATNLVTAIATAQMDSIPLVAVTGNVNLDLLGLDSFQEVDITGITMPVTKHNFLVRDAGDLAGTVREAFFIAGDGRKGAVLIDIPKDVTAAFADYEPAENGYRAANALKKRENPDLERQIKEAAELLRVCERPYIYTGGGVISAGAEKELALFARIIDAPVSSSLMGQGCFDQTDSRYIGMLGMHGTKAAAETVRHCDLFVALGTRFSDRVTGDKTVFAKGAKILHIDIDEAEHGKNVTPHIEVRGDLKEILARFNKMLPRRHNGDWNKKAKRLHSVHSAKQKGTVEFPVTPQAVITELDRLTDGEAIITTEVGQNQMWAAMYYRYKTPRSFISSGGLGTMGFGLGAAIGAKIGKPEKVVVNIAGDGSFGMNMNELITLAEHNIPVIELVLNNSVLGMVRQWQRLFYGKRFSETTLDRSFDYMKLADAFGIAAFKIKREDDVEPVLAKALETAKNRPVLIECEIDRDLNVLPMVPAGKPITDPIMEID